MRELVIFSVIIGLISMASAAHYISGWANDALDGELSDGKTVVMWNPVIGQSDNLTDIVGVTGMSGVSGVYFMDCEMLGAGCIVNTILSLKIFGDNYVSWVQNVTVTGAGYDVVENLSLNSPPDVELIYPVNLQDVSGSVDFNCSFFDYDDNVVRVALWGNWSGSWTEEASVTSGLEDGYVAFNENLAQGHYKWNCLVEDDLGISSFNESNNSFFVDTTIPNVFGVTSVSNVCGFGEIPVECDVVDNVGVGNVIIRSSSPSNNLTNYSAFFVSGDTYRTNVGVDEVGIWEFECFGYDTVGNLNYSFGENVSVGSLNADISFDGGINFSKNPEIEGEIINVSVNVTNFGCIGSGNFIVGFFDDGFNFQNETTFIGVNQWEVVIGNWEVDIGNSNISIIADLEDVLNEDNESDNFISDFAYMKAWQEIYGNLSMDLVLKSGADEIGGWGKGDILAGNVFITDSESNVDWNNLQALGRKKDGSQSSNDFSEIDFLLGMDSFNDSVENDFADSGIANFSVFDNNISNVSYINSSVNGNFITGILWDMSDSVDLEYDSAEGEDVVFVSKVNLEQIGSYGIYDYEINIPSRLRSYDATDEERVYLYYDLR